MRSQILRSVRKEFSNLLSTRLGQFKVDSTFKGQSGSDLYAWRWSDRLVFYVRLVPNPKSYQDSFIIELAWSTSEYPERAPLQILQRLNVASDGRIRLPQFWQKQWASAIEPWWEVGESLTSGNIEEFYSGEEALRRASAAPKVVEDAVTKIEEYAIPFFRGIASHRGIAAGHSV